MYRRLSDIQILQHLSFLFDGVFNLDDANRSRFCVLLECLWRWALGWGQAATFVDWGYRVVHIVQCEAWDAIIVDHFFVRETGAHSTAPCNLSLFIRRVELLKERDWIVSTITLCGLVQQFSLLIDDLLEHRVDRCWWSTCLRPLFEQICSFIFYFSLAHPRVILEFSFLSVPPFLQQDSSFAYLQVLIISSLCTFDLFFFDLPSDIFFFLLKKFFIDASGPVKLFICTVYLCLELFVSGQCFFGVVFDGFWCFFWVFVDVLEYGGLLMFETLEVLSVGVVSCVFRTDDFKEATGCLSRSYLFNIRHHSGALSNDLTWIRRSHNGWSIANRISLVKCSFVWQDDIVRRKSLF